VPIEALVAHDPTRIDSIRRNQEVGFQTLRRKVDEHNRYGNFQFYLSKYHWHFFCHREQHKQSQHYRYTYLGKAPKTL